LNNATVSTLAMASAADGATISANTEASLREANLRCA
jgi:hypothetical protein